MEGYCVLRLELGGRGFLRSLFARAHVSKGDETQLVAGQTLFVLNVPSTMTAHALKKTFGQVGKVKTVKLSSVPGAIGSSSTHAAHVVFETASGLRDALMLSHPLKWVYNSLMVSGVAGESREQMQKSVDSFMRNFDTAESRRRAEEEARHNQMDADGFVVVSRKRGRSTVTEANTGATIGVASTDVSVSKKKKKKGEMVDFYHFQQHERKREQLAKLREQFEADKEQIAKMKQERKFKPMGY